MESGKYVSVWYDVRGSVHSQDSAWRVSFFITDVHELRYQGWFDDEDYAAARAFKIASALRVPLVIKDREGHAVDRYETPWIPDYTALGRAYGRRVRASFIFQNKTPPTRDNAADVDAASFPPFEFPQYTDALDRAEKEGNGGAAYWLFVDGFRETFYAD